MFYTSLLGCSRGHTPRTGLYKTPVLAQTPAAQPALPVQRLALTTKWKLSQPSLSVPARLSTLRLSGGPHGTLLRFSGGTVSIALALGCGPAGPKKSGSPTNLTAEAGGERVWLHQGCGGMGACTDPAAHSQARLLQRAACAGSPDLSLGCPLPPAPPPAAPPHSSLRAAVDRAHRASSAARARPSTCRRWHTAR